MPPNARPTNQLPSQGSTQVQTQSVSKFFGPRVEVEGEDEDVVAAGAGAFERLKPQPQPQQEIKRFVSYAS